LVLCTSHRTVLTYEIVGRLIGVPRQGLGQLLEPIQSYCILKRLPPLSSLVVSAKSGLPGEGFIASSELPAAQAAVFDHPWLNAPPPSAADLESAASQLPSNGKSLPELQLEVQQRVG
jgi:hypothetical protein